MFGFDLDKFKGDLASIEEKLQTNEFEFIVDDIHVNVTNQKISHLNWKVEPTPDELMFAINQAFDELKLHNLRERETAMQNLLNTLKEPVKSMIESQFSTLLN